MFREFVKQIIKKVNKEHVREVFTYGMVGGTSWVVQTIVFWISLQLKVFPSICMVLGTGSGFIVAYFGHIRFTFRKTHRFSHKEFTKFLATSIIGLCINVGGVRVITKILLLDPLYGIIPTIFTPLITFLISKFWAFKD